MEKYLYKTACIFLLTLLIASCVTDKNKNDEYVLQIKNIGLRQGVFIRRYQLTGDYGSRVTFTPTMLKNYIQKILEPNYLLVQHAYDLGLNRDDEIKRKFKDYKIHLLANSHPIIFQDVTLLKKDVRDFYSKKLIKYDVDVVQTNSFHSADSLYQFMQTGGTIQVPQESFENHFINLLHYDGLLYGEKLHPELYPLLEKMQEGEIFKPVYAASIWTILKLNKKRENNALKPFEEMEKELLTQLQAIYKYNQQKQYVLDLEKKYDTSVHSDLYKALIDAYTYTNYHGWVDKTKLDKSVLKNTFIETNKDKITVTDFLFNFNQSISMYKLTENDLAHYIEDYIAQFVLYLDALEKGVTQDEMIQDKLENKEHQLLLSKYLEQEIVKKIAISEDEAKAYYNNNRQRWKTEYSDVSTIVKSDLKGEKITERKNGIIDKLKKKYKVIYNEPILQLCADQLTNSKKVK